MIKGERDGTTLLSDCVHEERPIARGPGPRTDQEQGLTSWWAMREQERGASRGCQSLEAGHLLSKN